MEGDLAALRALVLDQELAKYTERLTLTLTLTLNLTLTLTLTRTLTLFPGVCLGWTRK